MPFEELSFLYTLIEATDRLYEFWLTGTFALVLASFFISERMTTQLFSILMLVYVTFAVTMIIRYWAINARILETLTYIREASPESASSLGPIAIWFEMTSFFAGTIGAVFYLVHCYRNRKGV